MDNTVTQSATQTVISSEGSVPILGRTRAADRADIAAQCVRLAVDHTTAAFGKVGGAHAVDPLRDGAAYLSAAHHLLTDRAHECEQVVDRRPLWDSDPAAAAGRYIRTALLIADHLFAKPPAQAAGEVASPDRMATAHILTNLAVERLQRALTQLAGLQNGGKPATTPRGTK
jgi:hypothetical protein